VYWIVNLAARQLEVYAGSAEPLILTEHEHADLVIDGQAIGQIHVADLLPILGS
jgi:hypothetical protein